jgi:branched-chain amino acid transport system substrate-binding protein
VSIPAEVQPVTEEGQHVKKPGLLVATALLAIPLVFAAAGCGGGGSDNGGGGNATALPSSSCEPVQYGPGGTPDAIIASDLPLQGANRALTTEMAKAVAFVLESHDWKAGGKTIGFQSCDDATAQAGSWDSAKCTANARNYANNKSVLGIIGTFNSGCAKLEIPIANRAPGGPLAMVSPSNTYPGLTVGGPGTAPGEPNVYYPTKNRNYARVVWTDQFQGAADALFLQQNIKAKSVYVLTDKETYGQGIATLFRRAAQKLKIDVKGFQGWDSSATSYESIATAIKSSGAGAVFLGGIVCNNGGKLIKDLRAVLGASFPILMPDGWTPFSATGQTSGGASNGAYISYPGIPVNALKGAGEKFVKGFQKANGGKLPDPYTAYAAQAAQVLLTSIAKSNGTRFEVAKGLFGLKITNGILGNFSIDKNGDTTLGTVTFGRMSGQTAKFVKLITPDVKFVKG